MQPERREHYLKVVLVMVIFMMAGPEIIPAIEMTMLLELLGGVLFLSAFSAALRMVAQDATRFLADAMLPPLLITVFRHSSRPLEKGNIAGFLVFHMAYCVLMALVIVVFIGTHAL